MTQERPNPHIAWIVEWGAISLPLGHPSRITCLSIHQDEYEAACALYDASREYRARMWPISLNVDGKPGLTPEIAGREGCCSKSFESAQAIDSQAKKVLPVPELIPLKVKGEVKA